MTNWALMSLLAVEVVYEQTPWYITHIILMMLIWVHGNQDESTGEVIKCQSFYIFRD